MGLLVGFPPPPVGCGSESAGKDFQATLQTLMKLMSYRRLVPQALLGLAVSLSIGALPSAQSVGSQMTTLPSGVQLVDFGLTKATKYDDFLGRAVLLEFFAHW